MSINFRYLDVELTKISILYEIQLILKYIRENIAGCCIDFTHCRLTQKKVPLSFQKICCSITYNLIFFFLKTTASFIMDINHAFYTNEDICFKKHIHIRNCRQLCQNSVSKGCSTKAFGVTIMQPGPKVLGAGHEQIRRMQSTRSSDSIDGILYSKLELR